MRLATCRYQGEIRVVRVHEQGVTPILQCENGPGGMLSLIEAGPALWQQLVEPPVDGQTSTWPVDKVEFLAPIPRPRKNIMCLGWNYADHAQESQNAYTRPADLPEHPVVFTKSPTSVNGPDSDIPLDPEITQQLDWEVELGVIIGIGGRRISAARALKHVFGYTVINDISARDIQFRHKQYFLGKSLDGACPMGPVIVTADDIPDPQQLDLHCWVNGVLKQTGNTRQQIFPVARAIEILSQTMTLEPGDIIATGTPSGVGFARKPPEFLQLGDLLESEVQGIGKLRNRIV